MIISVVIGKDLNIVIPFYVLFHIFDITVDKLIYDYILGDATDNVKHTMMSNLFYNARTFDYSKIKKQISSDNYFGSYESTNSYDIALLIAKILNEKDTSTYKTEYMMSTTQEKATTVKIIMDMFDEIIFPHIGNSVYDRPKKLEYLGSLIKRIFGIRLGDDPSDRNSKEMTPVYGPSAGLMITMKTAMNLMNVTPILIEMQKAIRKSLTDIDLKKIYTNSDKSDNLSNTLGKFLKAGTKEKITIKKGSMAANRNTTQSVLATNKMTYLGVIRTITADPNSMGGKSNEPLLRSRGVHATDTGMLCSFQSVEGGSAGQSTHMAITSEITETLAIDIDDFKDMILDDIKESQKKYGSHGEYHSQVFLDGLPLGLYYDTARLVKKYRTLRLRGKIHSKISIEYRPLENGSMYIFTHLGRLIRPLIKVYHEDVRATWPDTLPEDKVISVNFAKSDKQWIKYTNEHAKRFAQDKMTYDDLVAEGVAEYISANEYKNIFVAPSFDEFQMNKNNPLFKYTHIDVPIAQHAISILAAPMGNNSQTVRAVYASKFIKQSLAGCFGNFGTSFHTKRPLRHNIYRRAVPTVVDPILNYGSTSIMVSVYAMGSNQEDSITVSENLVERGKFTVDTFSSINLELESNQIFANPDPSEVKNVKNIDYESYLVNGIPKLGSVISKGMVIIGIIETDNTGQKVDRSRYHSSNSNIIIYNVVLEHTTNGTRLIKVGYREPRKVKSGDKFGSNEGCKGVVSTVLPSESLPVTEDGMIPELVINPHSFPTRMVINQLLEGALGEVGIRIGKFIEATMYKKFDENIVDEVAKTMDGQDKYLGVQKMYDGVTGREIYAHIGVMYNGYMRLDKMADDQMSVADKTNIDFNTQQPKKGIGKGGGTKFGYMEIDTLAAHGISECMNYILLEECDAKELWICDNCGVIAASNPAEGILQCVNINCDKRVFKKVSLSYNFLKLLYHMNALGVNAKIITEKPTY